MNTLNTAAPRLTLAGALEVLIEMKNQDVKFSRDTYVLAFAVCYKLVRLLPLTFRALWIRFERGFIFSLQIKLSSYEVCFPSGADISSLNVFVFRRLKLAM